MEKERNRCVYIYIHTYTHHIYIEKWIHIYIHNIEREIEEKDRRER